MMNYSEEEEFWNTLTHGVGILLSITALVMMVLSADSGLAVVSTAIFGVTLVLLYTASTLYHANRDEKRKKVLKRIDHLSIYLLIAGTYTPVCLLGLQGAWGWTIFGLIWGLVLLGFIFKFSSWRDNKKLSLLLYGTMGWLIVIAIKPMLDSLSTDALLYLLLGGLLYTTGIYFYANKGVKYYHAIWHLFVLGGSVMHFLSVFLFILP
jgi:hemolysin III